MRDRGGGAKCAVPWASPTKKAPGVHVARCCALRLGGESGAWFVDELAGILVHQQALQGKHAPAQGAGAPCSAIRARAKSATTTPSSGTGAQGAHVAPQGGEGNKNARVVAKGAGCAALHVKLQLKNGNKALAKGALVLGAGGLVHARALVNREGGAKVEAAAGWAWDASGHAGLTRNVFIFALPTGPEKRVTATALYWQWHGAPWYASHDAKRP